MTRLNVNPTRMELKKLKARLATAARGHKLLKDKSDEMVRQFTGLVKRNMKLRAEVTPVYRAEAAFSLPVSSVTAECETGCIMGVDIPKITVKGKAGKGLPYAYPEMTSEADAAVGKAGELLPKLIELAEVEKTVRLLAAEIERNKRRARIRYDPAA